MAGAEPPPEAPPPPRRKGRTSAAGNATEKTLNLLEAASSGAPKRLGEIAAQAAVPKASAHRILRTMVTEGFLTSDDTGTYAPGPRLRALAARVGTPTNDDGAIQAELATLRQRTGQTVHVAMHSGDTVTYTHKVAGPHTVQMASRLGMQMPLHSTAIGKCVLAGLTEATLAEFTTRATLLPMTEHTLTDPNRLRAELATVRRNGFALDDEENEKTVRCLAAPLRNRTGTVIGGVSISTVTFLVPREELLTWADMVRQTAAAICAHLG